MSRTIEISDRAFRSLSRRAKANGVSRDALIENMLANDEILNNESTQINSAENPISLREALDDFIGAADRLPKLKEKRKPNDFGKILIKKYRKQGLKLDYFDYDTWSACRVVFPWRRR